MVSWSTDKISFALSDPSFSVKDGFFLPLFMAEKGYSGGTGCHSPHHRGQRDGSWTVCKFCKNPPVRGSGLFKSIIQLFFRVSAINFIKIQALFIIQ
jgi:hypothetical protein